MAHPSSQVLRIANMFRCPKASPFRLQHRRLQSMNSLVRPSSPCYKSRLSPLTFPRPSLSNPSRITPLLTTRHHPHPRPYNTPSIPNSTIYGEGPAIRLIPGVLIATCTAIFGYAQYAAQQQKEHQNSGPSTLISENFVLNLDNLRAGRYWTLLTHTLTHVEPIHLLVNMFGLWTFGQTAVMIFGPATFAALWLAAGVIGGGLPMAWQLYQQRQRQPGKAAAPASPWDSFRRESAPAPGQEVRYHGAVGASAAILGLVGAETCFAPGISMYVFPIPIAVPAYVALGGLAVFSVAAMKEGWLPGWAHLAHLSGMGVGVLAYMVALRRRFRWMAGPGRWR